MGAPHLVVDDAAPGPLGTVPEVAVGSPTPPSRAHRSTFAPGVAEKIGVYVYLLIDPRSGLVFYIGKGTADRCFDHILEARQTPADTSGDDAKLTHIREIEASGLSVRIELLRHGLSEREAFLVESVAIDLVRVRGLTNRAVGHNAAARGRMSVADVNALYGARPVTIAPNHRVVLIRISRNFQRGMSDDELYQATRRWWHVGTEARQLGAARAPEWAMAVFAGVVRAVYRITGWERPTAAEIAEEPNDARRWGFRGDRDPIMEEMYGGGDVSVYLSGPSQNPIRYVNCGRSGESGESAVGTRTDGP